MKKRKFKQFFKENWGWFAFVIWMLLVSITMTFATENISIWIKVSLVAICALYTIAGLAIISKEADKDEKMLRRH